MMRTTASKRALREPGAKMSREQVARHAKQTVNALCQPQCSSSVRDLFTFLLNPYSIPVERKRSFCMAEGKEPLLLKGCEYMGGGSEGYVLKFTEPGPFKSKRVVKVRELHTEYSRRSLVRELANCLFVTEQPGSRIPPVPFLGRMINWNLWNGSLAVGDRRGDTSIATNINVLLGHDASSPDYVIDFMEFVPDQAIREKICKLWLRSISADEMQHLERSHLTDHKAPIEHRYAASRANHFRGIGASDLPQLYATITQNCEGSCNMSDLLQMPNADTNREQIYGTCWTAEPCWTEFSSNFLVILHQIYTLQTRYHMMHMDFQTGNIVFMDSKTLPGSYANMWRPLAPPRGHVNRGGILSRPISIDELGRRVPIIIDLSQASFHFEAAAERLKISASKTDQDAAGRAVRIALGRNHIYSRTTDLRRLGLYFCYAMVHNVAVCFNLQRNLSQSAHAFYHGWASALRQNIGIRFARVAADMMAVPRAWLELARNNTGGLAQQTVESEHFSAPRCQTVEVFVARMIRLQSFLQLIQCIVHPNYAASFPDSGSLMEHMKKIEIQQRPTRQLIGDLIWDLNSMTDFIIQKGGCPELAADPLLPENIIRWDILALPVTDGSAAKKSV